MTSTVDNFASSMPETSGQRFNWDDHKKVVTDNTETPNFLRQGLLRYWGYINEIAEAFAPQIRKTFPVKPLGADLVSWWSYRLVDVYAGLDGLFSFYRTWEAHKDEKPFPRLWKAVTEGASAWGFQQLASVYLPATVVSGVRKGVESALHNKALTPLAGKHGIEKWLTVIEGPVSMATRAAMVGMKRLPGLATLLSHPTAKTWVPTVLASAVIPFIIKPIDALSEKTVDRTIKAGMDRLGRSLGLESTPLTEPTPLPKPSSIPSVMVHQAFNSFSTLKPV